MGKCSSFRNSEVISVHFNIVNNNYAYDWKVLYTFVGNISFDPLLDILPKNLIFLKTFNSEF